MEKNWVKVYESANEVKAEMARQLLEDKGIESVVINKKDRAYGFGEFELYCIRDKIIRAKQVLKEL